MENPQVYAGTLERTLCKIFDCDRFGLGGAVTADFARRYPFHSMVNGLAGIYATADSTLKTTIDSFIDSIYFYIDFSMDTLLDFDSNTKIVGETTYTLEDANGTIALKRLIKEFKDIVAQANI